MKEKIFITLNILFIVVMLNFFSYVNWDPTKGGQVRQVILWGIVLLFLYKRRSYYAIPTPFSRLVWLVMLVPFISTISKVFIYNESFYDLRITHLPLAVFLLFFVFLALKVKENAIIKIFTITGLALFAIQLFQTLFPDYAVFGVYAPDSEAAELTQDIAELRNGIYRFRISGYCITIFCMYYYWCRFLERMNIKRFLIFAVFFASMYLYLTRQIMAASMITLACSFMFRSSSLSTKIKYIGGILILGSILYSYSDVLFGSLVEQTQEDTMYGDNIRMLTYAFFWEKITEDPLLLVIGHGFINEMSDWAEWFGFYQNDIGVVGEWFVYGIFWLILYAYVLFQFIKYRKNIPTYILMYVFGTFLCCPMIFPYRVGYEFYIWACIFYISSTYVMANRNNNTFQKLS